MQQKSHSLLTVEQPPYIGSLIDGLLSDGNRLEVISVRTPEKALDLIKANVPFSVICTENEFRESEITGKQLLQKCQQINPLSSRILCSVSFTKGQFLSMVKDDEIHSYVDRSVGTINDSLLSATEISIEYHKVNLLSNYLDNSDFNSIDSVAESLGRLEKIEGKIGWKLGPSPLLSASSFKDREAEVNQLLLSNGSVTHRAIVAAKKISEMASNAGIAGNKENERLLQVLNHISHINTYLLEASLSLAKRTNQINKGLEQAEKNLQQTAKVDAFLNQFRND
ncbi:MAG: hypothetical protein HN472_03480 [Nitrospina sp.]|mgnify:FL=1|jgi:hypothetical protein|nr:hypothetical protein [Nitrospina sp.]MBT3508588.1 hypothetical protein [Nitrospina sp.]MBT3875364.1 hypothetical protein [Nitrospina sp.]MBT4048551.1 hypothetical protein [Nitrospina sp.]MBT4558979.1 hypothetical protein [Nitrospina sp.]